MLYAPFDMFVPFFVEVKMRGGCMLFLQLLLHVRPIISLENRSAAELSSATIVSNVFCSVGTLGDNSLSQPGYVLLTSQIKKTKTETVKRKELDVFTTD